MIGSQDTLAMLAQELVGSVLVSKSKAGRPVDAGTAEVNTDSYTSDEFAAMVRATGYAVGAGRVYGTAEWRFVYEYIRALVCNQCKGWDNDNADGDRRAVIVTDVVHALRILRSTYQH